MLNFKNKDLIIQSIEAHKAYTLDKIQSKKNRETYREIIDNVICYIEFYPNNEAWVAIQSMGVMLDSFPDKTMWGDCPDFKYKSLAIQQVKDIIQTINKRFF